MKDVSKFMSPEQLNAHAFLLEKFEKGGLFSKEEFENACGWPKEKTTFKTYWTKQFKPLVVELKRNSYRVSEAFRKLTDLDAFHKHVTQNKHLVAADYVTLTHDTVLMFEFFMPLANEGDLRTSLDSLFYKDSILTRLNLADEAKLSEFFPKEEGENKEAHLVRISDWVSDRFGGYSISHVSGRFRAAELMSRQEALDAAKAWRRYLVDETTAIVRFIFPCGQALQNKFGAVPTYMETEKVTTDHVVKEAAMVRYFFHLLFVTSIVEAVNGEDEIWLLESGMQSKLHIWRVRPEDAGEDE